MSTTTQTPPRDTTTTTEVPTKNSSKLFCMDGCFRKHQSSLGSATMATLLGSLTEEDWDDEEDDFSLGGWEGAQEITGDNYLPEDLEDFTCSSHASLDKSFDLHDLMKPSRKNAAADEDDETEGHDFCEPYESFHQSYDLGTSLGEGAFGTVHKCYQRSPCGRRRGRQAYAVKAVPMDKYNHDEIEILEDLMDCPNITQVHDVFHDLNESFIVMEEMQGGELLERIAEKEFYAEAEAKVLFKTLLETVQFCHSRGIAHCDIKPENVLLKYKDDDTTMQLADFGLAKRFVGADGERVRLFEMNGSAEYAAPEVFNRPEDDEIGYDERADIWSLGVVLYILLAGYAPFDGDGPWETIKKANSGKFKFHRQYWKDISIQAKILVVKMLQVNPDERISIEEALESPWFDDCFELSDEDDFGENVAVAAKTA